MKIEIENKELVKCVQFVSYFENFAKQYEGTHTNPATAWQRAYFEMLTWKNTWGQALELDIASNRDAGTFMRLVVKAEKKDMAKELLESNGYPIDREDNFEAWMITPDYEDGIYQWYIDE